MRFLLQHPAAAMRIRQGLEDPVTPSTNDEMVNSLVADGFLSSEQCIAAFRHVDRMHFAPESEKASAYAPMPLRDDAIHISAPPIYAEAVESLMPMRPGMSFLNIGSGTGYFNSIVAHLLNSTPYLSTNHGVELWPQAIAYCREKVKQYAHAKHCMFFHGNVYEIDVKNSMKYDRIYIGACASSKSKYLYELLEVGGVLVGPFQTSTGAQQLRRVTRVSHREFRTEVLKSVSFASLVEPAPTSEQKRFSLPEEPWTEARHVAYPESFRNALRTTMLCVQRSPVIPPKEIWTQHIFHWFGRHWFDVEPSKASTSNDLQSTGAQRSLPSTPGSRRKDISLPASSTDAFSHVNEPSSSSDMPDWEMRDSADVAAESSRGPDVSKRNSGDPRVDLATGSSDISIDVATGNSDLPTVDVGTDLPLDVATRSCDLMDVSTRNSEFSPADVAGGSCASGISPWSCKPGWDTATTTQDNTSNDAGDCTGSEDGFIEVFEDGRRHRIGHADDPDDAAPNDTMLTFGLAYTMAEIPIEMVHFLALAATERQLRRDAREEMVDSDDEDEDEEMEGDI